MVTTDNIFSNPVVEKRVPTDIYFALVNSLFSENKSLLFGALTTSAAILITAWKSGSTALYLCAMTLGFLGLLRWLDSIQFAKIKSSLINRKDMEVWELRYTAGAAFASGILGFWCFYSSFYITDSVVQLIAVSVTLSNVIGIFGRNFGIKRLVFVQLTFFSIPLIAGLFSQGNPYLMILAGSLLPFVASAKAIADRLRSTLLAAVIGRNEVSKLAKQLDAALNNMPQGLCMFDSQSRLAVFNDQASELLGINLVRKTGIRFQELISSCVRDDKLSANDIKRLLQHLRDQKNLRGLGSARPMPPIQLRFSNNRILRFSFQHMDNGGTVVVFEDITERVAADKKIKHLARYDSLTGLPNRAYFRATMNSALSKCDETRDCAVLVLDIDEFKQVNDSLGHPVGDELLRRIADRLKEAAGKNYPVSRFGGDEFVVLLPELRCKEEASALAGIIIDVLRQTFRVNGHDIVVGASIGISTTLNEIANADVLLRNADLALYRAKAENKGSLQFYEPEMGIQMEARLGMECDLRKAVKNEELSLNFQPLVNVESKRITTCEALLRWQHPILGSISPATFIPVAEEMGLIIDIGDWVLKKACEECNKWPGDVRVAVNLSAIQFKRGDVISSVKSALRFSGLPANRLELEITESVMLQDINEVRKILEKLQKLGVRISLDDFGTGYSSLSYLHTLPLHKVKIDRSFILNINSDKKSLTLCKNIAQMGRQLGLSIVVEGVETEEQLNTVTSEVCVDEIQGFLFSPPLSATNILAMVSASNGKALSLQNPIKPSKTTNVLN